MALRNVVKYMVGKTYKPLLERYLTRTRPYTYQGIHLDIAPGVFHPGYFFSTKLLLQCVMELPLRQKIFLEPGAGSGLISIYAAKQGALVTATDINLSALDQLGKSVARNKVDIKIFHSDLFDKVPVQTFDIIAINPPYYKKEPQSPGDFAWFCGVNGEYYEKLFATLPGYIHRNSVVYMVLCDGCDLGLIFSLARKNKFRLILHLTKKTILEKNFVYKIEYIG